MTDYSALIAKARKVATYPYPGGSPLYEQLADALEVALATNGQLRRENDGLRRVTTEMAKELFSQPRLVRDRAIPDEPLSSE